MRPEARQCHVRPTPWPAARARRPKTETGNMASCRARRSRRRLPGRPAKAMRRSRRRHRQPAMPRQKRRSPMTNAARADGRRMDRPGRKSMPPACEAQSRCRHSPPAAKAASAGPAQAAVSRAPRACEKAGHRDQYKSRDGKRQRQTRHSNAAATVPAHPDRWRCRLSAPPDRCGAAHRSAPTHCRHAAAGCADRYSRGGPAACDSARHSR